MDIFSTRELATAFWVGAILIAVGMAIVTNKKIRQGFIGVLKCFLQEAKEIMGNIFLVHRNNHADVFKVSNMEKYIFKRYYSLDAFFWIDYLYECSRWRS